MPVPSCRFCGGALRRSRRTLFERIFYSEAYVCVECKKRVRMRESSFSDLRHAHYVKCPRCHSVDLNVLRRRDTVDKMQRGLINLFHRLMGGRLYHCWFCRLQFYDLRQQYDVKPRRKLLPPPDDTEESVQLAS